MGVAPPAGAGGKVSVIGAATSRHKYDATQPFQSGAACHSIRDAADILAPRINPPDALNTSQSV